MCGIVGSVILGASAAQVDIGVLQRMRDALIHRGPDGGDQWVDDRGKVGLATNTLDLTRGFASSTGWISSFTRTLHLESGRG